MDGTRKRSRDFLTEVPGFFSFFYILMRMTSSILRLLYIINITRRIALLP